MKKVCFNSLFFRMGDIGLSRLYVMENFYVEDDEDIMCVFLEMVVINVIDFFQNVDKQQLLFFGVMIDLIGFFVEKFIECYVVENVYYIFFFRLMVFKWLDDLELEVKIW